MKDYLFLKSKKINNKLVNEIISFNLNGSEKWRLNVLTKNNIYLSKFENNYIIDTNSNFAVRCYQLFDGNVFYCWMTFSSLFLKKLNIYINSELLKNDQYNNTIYLFDENSQFMYENKSEYIEASTSLFDNNDKITFSIFEPLIDAQ